MIIIIGYSSLLPRNWVRNAKLLPAGKLRGSTAHIFLIFIITLTTLSYSPDYCNDFDGIATLLKILLRIMMMMENMLTYLSRPDCLSWLPFVLNNHFFRHQILTFHINVKIIKLKNLPIRDDLNHRYFYRTQVRSLPCLVSQSLRHCVLVLNFVPIVAFVEVVRRISLSRYTELSNLMQGFLCVVIWICQSCYMDLWKLLHGFVKVVTCFSRPLPNETKLKFDQHLKLVDWLKELIKV